MFVVSLVYSPIIEYLGLSPERVIESGWIWQIATYMFLHGDAVHILFNMLGIWMFGTELERLWRTQFFLRFYAVTGLGAGLTVIGVGLLPVRGHGVDLRRRHDRRVGRALRSADGVRALLSRTARS